MYHSVHTFWRLMSARTVWLVILFYGCNAVCRSGRRPFKLFSLFPLLNGTATNVLPSVFVHSSLSGGERTLQAPRVPHRTFAVDSSSGKQLRVPEARAAPQSPGSLQFCPSWPLSALPECLSPGTWLQDWSSAGPVPRNVSPGLASGVFPRPRQLHSQKHEFESWG